MNSETLTADMFLKQRAYFTTLFLLHSLRVQDYLSIEKLTLGQRNTIKFLL